MKILVTGANGQLGTELRRILEKDHPGITTYTDIDSLDLTDPKAVDAFVRDNSFTHVVNCAAYTAVDRAEEEKSLCTAVNIGAVQNLAAVCSDLGIKMLHISTDYVFDGTAHKAYTESDKPAPMSHYGSTKRKSETALMGLLPEAIIVRTGWLYSPYGHNFVKTILAKCQPGATLRVVNAQIGTPTYAADLANMIVRIITARQWLAGIYHFSNEGVASWYDFAQAIAELSGVEDVTVLPVSSDDYVTAAARPLFSVLDKSKIKASYGVQIPYWRSSLKLCIDRLNCAKA